MIVSSTLIGRFVAVGLENHVQENKLRDQLQSADKQHHSTETALIINLKDTKDSLRAQSAVILVVLDMPAAIW